MGLRDTLWAVLPTWGVFVVLALVGSGPSSSGRRLLLMRLRAGSFTLLLGLLVLRLLTIVGAANLICLPLLLVALVLREVGVLPGLVVELAPVTVFPLVAFLVAGRLHGWVSSEEGVQDGSASGVRRLRRGGARLLRACCQTLRPEDLRGEHGFFGGPDGVAKLMARVVWRVALVGLLLVPGFAFYAAPSVFSFSLAPELLQSSGIDTAVFLGATALFTVVLIEFLQGLRVVAGRRDGWALALVTVEAAALVAVASTTNADGATLPFGLEGSSGLLLGLAVAPVLALQWDFGVAALACVLTLLASRRQLNEPAAGTIVVPEGSPTAATGGSGHEIVATGPAVPPPG